VFASTAAFGSAVATGAAASMAAMTSAHTRVEIFLEVAIVCAD
jgi:hypothetical protein